jgi:hypothetical protein
MIVLVCGGRDYADAAKMKTVLDQLFDDFPKACILQGGARGADRLAKEYCARRGFPCLTMDAPWGVYFNSAGSIRNKWMLQYCNVAMVLHFPGGRGTAHMVNEAQIWKIPTYAC